MAHFHTLSPSKSVEPLVIGVDVGGTKIAAGVVDAIGRVYGRVKLPANTSYPDSMLHTIISAITTTLDTTGIEPARIAGIGLGIPGKVDPEHGVSLFAVNLGWHNVPIKQQLEEALKLPCSVDNDASAACLGESLYGMEQPITNMVYLSLGTGIAARAMINGKLYRGTNGLAGELGHAIFVEGGPLCLCGAHGCLEALASGPALARIARTLLESEPSSLLHSMTHNRSTLTAETICEAATRGDHLALRVLEEAAMHLAYAIHLLAFAYNPQRIVLGGGMAQEGPYIAAIRRHVVRLSAQSPLLALR
jgi:glucokinase